MQLVSLIRKDELNVQEEREVYNAVLKWVKYDEDNRYPKMEHILYAVRCQFLTPNFLKEQMKNCDVLRKVPACREYLARIFKDLTLHKRPVVKERTPNTTRMIFIAGGYFKNSLDMLEGFNVDDKTWITLPKLRVPRSGLGAAFLKGNNKYLLYMTYTQNSNNVLITSTFVSLYQKIVYNNCLNNCHDDVTIFTYLNF